MSNEFWAAAARDWVYYQAPLRPSEKVVASYRQVLDLLPSPKQNQTNYVRVLGVTPELISLFAEWPENSGITPWSVTCVDSSPEMIEWVGIPAKKPKQPLRFRNTKWDNTLNNVDLVLADDVLIQTPTRYLKSFFIEIEGSVDLFFFERPEETTSDLSWGGLLAIRSLQSTKATVQDVVSRIGSQINSVHSLKWELAAALQLRLGTENLGVSASYVYDACHQMRSAGTCSGGFKTGWYAPDWGTLDSYKNSAEKLYFHTETEIITAAVAAGLTLVNTYTGDYDDGRDNILVFQKDKEKYYQNTQTIAIHEHY